MKTVFSLFFILLLIPHFAFSQCAQVDSLEAVLHDLKAPKSRVDALNRLAHLRMSEPNRFAEQYAQEAFLLADKEKYTVGLAFAHINLSDIAIKKDSVGNYDKALGSLQKAVSLLKDTKKELAEAYERLGRFYYDFFHVNEENYQKSLENYQKALKIREELKDRLKIADDMEMIGELYGDLNEDKKSIDFLTKAVNLKKELGKRVSNDIRMVDKANRLYFYETKYSWVYNAWLTTIIIGLVAVFLVAIFFGELGRRRANKIQKLDHDLTESHDELKKQHDELVKEQNLNAKFNFLPPKIYRELHFLGHVKPIQYNDVSILFADLEDFTAISKVWHTQELMDELSLCFSHFDEILEKYNLTKLKSFGDSYMAVGGLPDADPQNPVKMVLAALEMIRFIDTRRAERIAKGEVYWKMRAGINTGYVIAGVVGNKKLNFDVWGEAVNIAKTMEMNSMSGKVNISEFTHQYVTDFFDFEPKSIIPAIKTADQATEYIVTRIKPALSAQGGGTEPNEAFWALMGTEAV
jgi:class 3 adenylate cyclase